MRKIDSRDKILIMAKEWQNADKLLLELMKFLPERLVAEFVDHLKQYWEVVFDEETGTWKCLDE